jgi:hypothetical protein
MQHITHEQPSLGQSFVRHECMRILLSKVVQVDPSNELSDKVFQRQSNLARFDQAFDSRASNGILTSAPWALLQINSGNQRTGLPFFSQLGELTAPSWRD